MILFDKCQDIFGKVPTCIIDDNAQFFVVFSQSFDECEIFFAIGFWTEFSDHFAKPKRAECASFEEWSLDILLYWPRADRIPSSRQIRF